MSKLIGTRIRKEESKHRTDYFPEYCVEEKTWFGKVKQQWYGVSSMSCHNFGEAYRGVRACNEYPYFSLEFAQAIIDFQASYAKEFQEIIEHEQNKQTTYIKYP